jgi:predicted nucleotidyltransferase
MSDRVSIVDYSQPIRAIVPGVQGKLLAVLAETSAALNLRTVARLADVSIAQASRVLSDLVELGLVERTDAPPSALFMLVREHVAAKAILDLLQARERVLDEMGRAAASLPVPPVSVIVFGSLARGEADRASDIDAVVVRPADRDEDDEAWASSIEGWRRAVGRASGNRVEVLEEGMSEIGTRLRSEQPLWRDINRDGLVVYGRSLAELEVGRVA